MTRCAARTRPSPLRAAADASGRCEISRGARRPSSSARRARRDRRRLGHRRATALARRRRAPAARERDRHRRRPRRADPRVRPGVGRALQPGRHAGRPHPRRHVDARRRRLRRRAGRRRVRRRDGRQPDVRPPGRRRVDAHPLVGRRSGSARSSPTFGLAARDPRCRARRPRVARRAFAVGGYIAAAYWFTSSTSFANPAVTIGRMLSDTFAGIAPASVPMFVVMQVARRAGRGRAGPLPLPRDRPPPISSCPTTRTEPT